MSEKFGCGYQALALCLARRPQEIVEAAQAKGYFRGVGMYTHGLNDLARHFGGRLISRHVRKVAAARRSKAQRAWFGDGRPMVGPTVAAWIREARAEKRGASFVLHVDGHFIGVVVTSTGGAATTGARTGWMQRARVIDAWEVRQ